MAHNSFNTDGSRPQSGLGSVMLSPMAGFTDAPMRLICSRFGAIRTFTEMVNAAGLARDGDASWALLETLPGEPKPFAHLYGSNPDEFAAAAEKVAATGRFSGIDINAGCPAPKVVREGAGSALMRNPRLVGRIVAAAKAASGLPVSVKTRISYPPSDITVFALLAEAEAEVAALQRTINSVCRWLLGGRFDVSALPNEVMPRSRGVTSSSTRRRA